jgi:ribosomal protein S18 acetylase RimI-like enzyme
MAHWYIKHPRCIMPLWKELNLYLAAHGLRKIIGSTPGDNERALRMIFRKLGFVEIARIKDGWGDGVDIVISECEVKTREHEQQVAA